MSSYKKQCNQYISKESYMHRNIHTWRVFGGICCFVFAIITWVLYVLTKAAIFGFLGFLTCWLLFIIFTVKPVLRYQFRILTGKWPTDRQLKKFAMVITIGLPALVIFTIVHLAYPTTPINYLIRTLLIGSVLIICYYIYRYARRTK